MKAAIQGKTFLCFRTASIFPMRINWYICILMSSITGHIFSKTCACSDEMPHLETLLQVLVFSISEEYKKAKKSFAIIGDHLAKPPTP